MYHSAMRNAWIDGVYEGNFLHELSTAVEEMASLLRCRKVLSDEGLRSLLNMFQSMKTHYVRHVNCGLNFFLVFCSIVVLISYFLSNFIIFISFFQEENVARGQVQPSFSVLSLEDFQQTMDLVQRAVADPKYLEKRQPKLTKLKEILADHFGRHGRAGSSTRALVFTQLRSTVHEIKTEISEVHGK